MHAKVNSTLESIISLKQQASYESYVKKEQFTDREYILEFVSLSQEKRGRK